MQKILASAGVASRRRSEELILAGRVSVNGQVVRELGAKADPAHDAIEVDGTPLPSQTDKVYYALNKPTGYITSVTDPKGRRTVMALAPEVPGLHPVGRLDYDTSGLLLLTNDGDLTLAMTHPRYGVPKTYDALVEGHPTERILQRLRDGLRLEDGYTASAKVVALGTEGDQSRVRITIHEGRNRQVRRMFAAIGHPVVRLKRLSVGTVSIEGIALGGYRPLTPQEVVELKQQTGHEEGQP
ncbi:MAG TPA: pseudouridine synthase [Pantanalinema sp.]